jgi:hypothetical protein
MLYPEVALNDWIKKHGLHTRTKKCAKCGVEHITVIPVLIRGYAGLETPTHECGRQYNAAIFTPITVDSIGAWSELLFS